MKQLVYFALWPDFEGFTSRTKIYPFLRSSWLVKIEYQRRTPLGLDWTGTSKVSSATVRPREVTPIKFRFLQDQRAFLENTTKEVECVHQTGELRVNNIINWKWELRVDTYALQVQFGVAPLSYYRQGLTSPQRFRELVPVETPNLDKGLTEAEKFPTRSCGKFRSTRRSGYAYISQKIRFEGNQLHNHPKTCRSFIFNDLFYK